MNSWLLLCSVAAITVVFFIKYFNSEDPVRDTESEYIWVTRKIEEVLVMFPNADTSQVAYELSRHRSVEGCIQKLIDGEELEEPPQESRYYGWDLKLEGMDLASARTTRLAGTLPAEDVGMTADQVIKTYNLQRRAHVESVPEDD